MIVLSLHFLTNMFILKLPLEHDKLVLEFLYTQQIIIQMVNYLKIKNIILKIN